MNRILAVFQRKFLAGLVVVVPAVATVLAIRLLFRNVDGLLGPWISHLVGRDIPGLGLIATLLLVLLAGVVASSLVGRKILKIAERVFTEVPLIRRVYGASKEIVSSATLSQERAFKDVVIVEYPRMGTYTYGFVMSYTNIDKGGVSVRLANVFLPGPPLPTTGVLVAVPVEDVVFLDMPTADGLKLILSVGITAPDRLEKRQR
jgi:uncharacterized membrane protein